MYGKWLFKEIKTEYGQCKVEIFRKNFTDTAIEIGALESNSLTLAMENLGNITDPIGKSVCSFSIIDTDQIDYDEFFTPDATAYMVVVSTKIEGGAYVTRWSGYITPDFFAENLSYRTPISISARDNIGYLNDVDFDLDVSTITVRELIQAAFSRIAEDYPMQLVFATQKQTAEGVLAIDATISTMLLREGTWYEAIETVLHDLGLQMRWVDNNTIAVLDLSQIPEYYATQAFNFVDASGYREILPAWRELAQEQDYGLRENFFEGQINNANLRFVKEETLNLPLSMGGVTGNPVMKYYAPSNWGVAGSTLTINTDNYKYIGSYGQEPSGQGGRIYFTGVQKDAANLPQNYMSYRQPVYVSQRGKMSIAFKAFNSLLATNKTSAETLQVYNPADRFMDFATGDSLQLGLKINVFLHVGTKTFILGDTWEEITGAETNSLYFTLDKVGQLGTNGTATPTEQEITIDVNTIPYNGELELRIYGFCIHEKTNLQEDAGLATYDWLKMVSYIDDVRYSYERELATGQGARTEIAPLHNVKESKSYKFGQVPVYAGGINAYAGGLYNASKNMESMVLFQRNASATSYNLLELIGREVIHFNKKNYNKLSGTIRNLAKEPLMFNRLFIRNGKRYAPFAYSLNIISNQMEITTMQEVENYVTESFSEINSAVTTGGAIVSAGNNTVMQYSQDAGNTKRIYELTAATEEEKKDTWVMIDGTAFPEARKINVKDLEGLNEEQVEAYLTANAYAKESWVTNITKGLAQDIANRVLYEDFEKLEDAVDDNRQSIGVVQGYFNNGVANDASKLGGKAPSHYATATALGTTNTNVDNVAARVATLEGNFKGGDAKNALKLGEHLPEYFATAEGLNTVNSALTAAKNRVTTLEGYFSGGIAKEAAKVSNALTFGSKTFNGYSAQTILASDLDAVTTAGGQTITGAKTFSALITANGGIVVPKTKSIKVGDAELVWDDNIKALKVVGAMYTTGTFAFGGDEEPESGGGGAAGIVTVRVNGYDYNSVNGIVTLPDYPSLSGYATESWVNNKGYITGINSTMVTNALGFTPYNSSNPSGYITSAALNGYATQSWVGDNYLPLSGGTIKGNVIIQGDSAGLLQINRQSSTSTTYITFLGNNSLRGRIGFNSSNQPVVQDISISSDNQLLIHSGNIGSQYVAGLKEITASDENLLGSLENFGVYRMTSSSMGGDGYIMDFNWNLSPWKTQIFVDVDATYRIGMRHKDAGGTWTSWKQFAFTDSNVASATKLQTARTIWGQSFDGTGDVSGVLSDVNQISFDTNKSYGIFRGDWYSGSLAREDLAFYAPRSVFGGNVLMGSTTDRGYKLDIVGGNCRVSSSVSATSAISASNQTLVIGGYNAGVYGYNVGLSFNVLSRYGESWGDSSYKDHSHAWIGMGSIESSSGAERYPLVFAVNEGSTINSSPTERMRITSGGNIIMGTTSDNGARLQVNGSVTTYGDINLQSAGEITYAKSISLYDGGTGYYVGSRNAGLGATDGGGMIYTYGATPITFHTNGSERVRINGSGGNVLIGTTSDNGYKLQVEGSFASYSYSGEYGTLGTRPVGASLFGPYAYGLLTWVRGDGNAYMQVGRTDNQAIAYNLVMQHLGGNVLIGATSDSGGKLQISGNIKFLGGVDREIGTAYSTTDVNTYNRIVIGCDNTGIKYCSGRWTGGNVTSHSFCVGLNDTTAMAIMNNGNVLVGAPTDNGAKLQVEGDVTAKVLTVNNNGDGGGAAGLSLYYTKNFVNTYGIHMSHTSAFGTGGDVTGDWATYFSMTAVGNGGWIFRGINGNVVAISNTSGNLTVSGGATFGGDVAVTGALSWSSDIRLKDNVTYLSAEHSLGIIRQLKPTSWNWKKDGKASFGFIAQEVQPIIPEMVTNGEYLHLQYNHLHAFEIGAIQHIDNEVETLKKDLKVANNRIEALENELKQYRRS